MNQIVGSKVQFLNINTLLSPIRHPLVQYRKKSADGRKMKDLWGCPRPLGDKGE